MSVKELKKELRAEFKRLRLDMSADERLKADKSISERVLSLPEYKNADAVFAFVSKDIEVNTEDIINTALSDGKRVAVPLCHLEDTSMDFYYIDSYDELKRGCFGILEPDAGKCEKAVPDDIPLMLVPGLAFDKKGYRVGFGKGFYDRFISDYRGLKVGICYSGCVVNTLPADCFDRPVNIVITDKYILDVR